MEAVRRVCRVAWVLLLTIAAWQGVADAGQLSLTWLDSSTDELGFSIERSTGGAGAYEEIGSTGPGLTAFVDSSVSDGTTYCYRVRAYSATSYSDYSNVACGATAQAFGLAVVKMGTGSGTVISSPDGIICGSTCSATFPAGMGVLLTATAPPGSVFSGWSGGGCSGTGSCTVTVNAATTVTATFSPQPSYTLSVSKAGTGSGTVTSTPAGISCGTTCSASYTSGTAVTLTPAAASGSTFTGWGGACSGTGSCVVTMSAATSVTATFASQTSSLSVSLSGKGSVVSSPLGILCGKTCSATYPSGTNVTLTAVAGSGFTFTGWGGACAGTGSCTVNVVGAKSVTATFKSLPKRTPTKR